MDKPAKGTSTGFLQSLRGLPANVWVVTATSFLTDVSSEMIFNLVPLFLANVLHAGTAIIGLIDGLAETTASLMKIYAGGLSDKLGRRKWLTVLGYGISTVAKPFLPTPGAGCWACAWPIASARASALPHAMPWWPTASMKSSAAWPLACTAPAIRPGPSWVS